MKKAIVIFLLGSLFACNGSTQSSSNETNSKDASSSKSEGTQNYPYKIDNPDFWEIGSSSNTLICLNALKAWEDGKFDEMSTYFADSVSLKFNAFDKTLALDSVKAMLTNSRNKYKSVKIKMDDWESVISKDKSQEWVTMWYRQIVERQNGELDSVDCVDDLKMKNGKIERITEYTRKLH